MRPTLQSDETRAEIARRRLAKLAASFDAQLPPEGATDTGTVAARRIQLPHIKVLVTLAVAGSVLLVWWLLSGRPHASGPDEPVAFQPTNGASTSPGTPAGSATATPAEELVIDVVGKVRKPGIVTVPKGSRVYEAIEAAGGVKGNVDLSSVNMARVLADGEQILVGTAPATVPGPGGGGTGGQAAGAPTAKINLNTATAEQLDTLPGVGPVTAQAILSWREENGRFSSVEDLLDVKGIGDATLADLRDLVTV